MNLYPDLDPRWHHQLPSNVKTRPTTTRMKCTGSVAVLAYGLELLGWTVSFLFFLSGSATAASVDAYPCFLRSVPAEMIAWTPYSCMIDGPSFRGTMASRSKEDSPSPLDDNDLGTGCP